MSDKVNLTKDGYEDLLNKVLKNKLEERELALDRYRRADQQMSDSEQFVLMGKNAVSFLTLAANSTNEMAKLATEIKSIVYPKDDSPSKVEMSLSDDWKKRVVDEIGKKEKERKENSEE